MSDKILYRILYGKIRCKLSDAIYLVYPVKLKHKLIAEEIYEESYQRALLDGCSSRKSDKHLRLLFLEGLNPNYQNIIKDNNSKIENLKVDIYNLCQEKRNFNEPKKSIEDLQTQNTALINKQHSLDHLTAEGIAEFTRNKYLMRMAVRQKVDDNTLTRIANWLAANRIDESDYRAIARSNTWALISNAQDKYTFSLFKNPAELTDEQLNFLYWNKFYNNVYQHPERPFDWIIETDLALDGWCIVQKRKSGQQESVNYVDGKIKTDAVRNSTHIFIPTTPEMVEKVYNANDEVGRAYIKGWKSLLDKGKLNDTKENALAKGLGIT